MTYHSDIHLLPGPRALKWNKYQQRMNKVLGRLRSIILAPQTEMDDLSCSSNTQNMGIYPEDRFL